MDLLENSPIDKLQSETIKTDCIFFSQPTHTHARKIIIFMLDHMAYECGRGSARWEKEVEGKIGRLCRIVGQTRGTCL